MALRGGLRLVRAGEARQLTTLSSPTLSGRLQKTGIDSRDRCDHRIPLTGRKPIYADGKILAVRQLGHSKVKFRRAPAANSSRLRLPLGDWAGRRAAFQEEEVSVVYFPTAVATGQPNLSTTTFSGSSFVGRRARSR
jgi:hypothetical protein